MKNQKTSSQHQNKMSRGEFLGATTAAAAAFTIVPRHVLGGPGNVAPSDKLNIACVGIGGMGRNNLGRCETENIYALCDVDQKFAGRIFAKYPKAKQYTDFRKMLEREKSIDAVIVATPDHTHAVIAMMAMKLGKHVYVQKPLTHTVYEARLLTEAARKYKVATQMGNQGHSGEGVRYISEWIWDGAIGDVHEVHAWTNRPTWAQGMDRPEGSDPVPPTLDWDLWIGPAPFRPYVGPRFPFGRIEKKRNRGIYHYHDWRAWWDFGGGAIGDLFCHVIDPVFSALKLKYPISVEASIATDVDVMRGKYKNNETYPRASIVRYKFPAREGKPPVKLTWYDGGLIAERPIELEPDRRMGGGGSGVIFVGDKGKLMCGEYGDSPRLIPESRMRAYELPPKTIPRIEGNHEGDWLRACKDGKPAGSDFEYSGPFTEAALLGNVAIRTGKKLDWDGPNMKITNVPEANEYLHKEYREGWADIL